MGWACVRLGGTCGSAEDGDLVLVGCQEGVDDFPSEFYDRHQYCSLTQEGAEVIKPPEPPAIAIFTIVTASRMEKGVRE